MCPLARSLARNQLDSWLADYSTTLRTFPAALRSFGFSLAPSKTLPASIHRKHVLLHIQNVEGEGEGRPLIVAPDIKVRLPACVSERNTALYLGEGLGKGSV